MPRPRSEAAVGLLYTAGAFTIWGLGPIFWKALGHVPAQELLAHRVGWCGVLMLWVLTWQKGWRAIPPLLRRRRTLAVLVLTTALIASNWFVYVWAVNSERILETSLGYFINPLLSVLLGMVFLGETLRRAQVVSVALAATGVLVLTWRVGQVPWVSLFLAVTFGVYALLRKKVDASPEQGLAVEMWLLTPLAAAYLVSLEAAGQGSLGHAGLSTHVLLVLTGAITATPLVWFTHGARRLPLTTVGLLQYTAPTAQFLLAVVVYREPFEMAHLVAFLFIWTALGIFTVDAHAAWRRSRMAGRGAIHSP